MKTPVASFGAIKKVIMVVCPNRFGLHNGVYVRYLILLDGANPPHSVWYDDPEEEEVRKLFTHLIGAKSEVMQAQCPWCHAKSDSPYS